MKVITTFYRIISFIKRYIYAVCHCLYTFTFGIFFTKSRLRLYDICHIFKSPSEKGQEEAILQKIKISEVVSENITVEFRGGVPKNGNASALEIVVINKLVKQFGPLNVFEIGTFDGLTTLNIAANSREDVRIYTLDLPRSKLDSVRLTLDKYDKQYIEKDVSGVCFLETSFESKITQLYGDSATFDFSPYNTMDFVFVDASHAYEYVLNDSQIAIKLLRNKRGIILWHDYGTPYWPGVTKALNKLYLNNSEFSCIKHIDETCFAILVVK